MDLSALGIPLEPVRDVWLIAFMAYTFACLLVDIAYPVNIPAAKAQELFVAVKGDPVEGAKIRVEDMARNGLPLSSSQKGWVTKRAKKQLESISGSSIVGGWVHVLMYLWAWMVMVSTFTLYWDMAYDGILLPALALPFLMVYAGARWGRRSWRTARGFSADERTLGMPRIYSATLGQLSAPFRVKGAVPGIGPIHLDRAGFWVLQILAALSLLYFLYSLSGLEVEDFDLPYVGHASMLLGIGAVLALLTGWVQVRSYILFNPDSFVTGRVLLPAKTREYSTLRAFRVLPNNPDAIKTDTKDPAQWKVEVMLPNGSKRTFPLNDPNIDCLIAQLAFKLEQGDWARLDSPADREKLARYFLDGRAICTTLGHIPAGKHAEEAARRASFQKAQYK